MTHIQKGKTAKETAAVTDIQQERGGWFVCRLWYSTRTKSEQQTPQTNRKNDDDIKALL
jgi:hypothetical protein